MCSGTHKCLIQLSSESVYYNVNCYICVMHFYYVSAMTEPICGESSGCCSSQSLLAGETSDDESSLYEDDREEISELIICMFLSCLEALWSL